MTHASFQKDLSKIEGPYERIIEWNEFADESENEIKRFIFRWISFNGLYSASYEMEKGEKEAENAREWQIVMTFCDEFVVKDHALSSQIYSDQKKKFFEENIKVKSNHMGEYLNDLKNATTKGQQAKYMVMIAYKIRCRLFHGEKNPTLEVNKLVINTADQVIKPILTNLAKLRRRND